MAHAAAHIKKARSEMDQPPDLKALEKARERRRRSRERAERKRKVPGRLTGIIHLFLPSHRLLHPTSSHSTTSHPSTLSPSSSSSSSSECHFTFTNEDLFRVHYQGLQKSLQIGIMLKDDPCPNVQRPTFIII